MLPGFVIPRDIRSGFPDPLVRRLVVNLLLLHEIIAGNVRNILLRCGIVNVRAHSLACKDRHLNDGRGHFGIGRVVLPGGKAASRRGNGAGKVHEHGCRPDAVEVNRLIVVRGAVDMPSRKERMADRLFPADLVPGIGCGAGTVEAFRFQKTQQFFLQVQRQQPVGYASLFETAAVPERIPPVQVPPGEPEGLARESERGGRILLPAEPPVALGFGMPEKGAAVARRKAVVKVQLRAGEISCRSGAGNRHGSARR